MTALSLASVLAEPARRRPGATALVEGSARLTYGQLWHDARAAAAAAQAAAIPGLDVAGLGESQRPFRTFVTRQAEDLAVILYTSGTTGTPKGAMLSHRFRTGDIGTKDADGFVTIVDRRKDLIIRAGFNVYPREIEEVLSRHPDVGQVAVIGVPDAERGEEVCAVVVPRPGHSVEVDALLAWGKENLAHHKYPRLVRVLPELPVGPSQKVLKRELRRHFSA